MTAISPATRQKIKGYLEGFIEALIQEYKDHRLPVMENPTEYLAQQSAKGRLKPFHAAIIPEALMRINEFERRYSTRLGATFEECARLIALEHHQDARRGYALTGNVSTTAVNQIEHQISFLEHAVESGTVRPSLEQMIESVLQARRDDDLEPRTVVADLYVLAHDKTEFFFEIKSPQPNKGQCLEVTQRILRFHLLRGKPRLDIRAYFAMAYNPYGPERDHYRWSFAREYMDFEQTVALGQEFWAIIGGPTAYEELLEIYQEVGRERSKYVVDALGFGF